MLSSSHRSGPSQEDLVQGFRLGDLRVEPMRGLVTRPDGTGCLSPKAADVLLLLASTPGQLWSRNDLIAEVWADGRGSQEALHRVVSALRFALADRPDHPRYIQTVPKRGYRLLVKPAAIERTTPAEPADAQPDSPTRDLDFIAALKRGGVIETALAYLVLGWLLIQVADATFEQLMVPPWVGTFVTVLIIVGFPIAVVLAWVIETVSSRDKAGQQQSSRPATNFFSRSFVSIGGAMLLAAAGVYVYDQSFGLFAIENDVPDAPTVLASATPIDPNSIAVLRFLNIDGSEETNVFSNGLAEDVMTRLARVPSLRVSARGDAFLLPPNASSADVRKRLQVRYYLEGSVRLTDRSIRVVIHLINSENGFRVLSQSFDRDRTEYFAIQDEITNLTVARLRVVLPPETQLVSGSSGKYPDLDAYLLYRRGMEILHQPMTVSTINEALAWFGRSLERDPEFAAAHAGLCTTYAQGFNVTNEPAYIAKAEKACGLALDRNPHLDVVHGALGDLYSRTGRDRDAEIAYKRALEINVNSVHALGGLADVYYRGQRLDEAEAMYRRAIGLQPGNWATYNALGWFLFQSGRYAEAAEEYRKIVSIDSTNVHGYSNLGGALMLSGDFAEAAAAFMRAIEIEPRRDAYSHLGLLYYYLGKIDDAVIAHEKAIQLAPNDHLAWANLGDALSFTTKKGSARAAFSKAEELAETKLSINPLDAETLIDLAWIKAMLGKREDAWKSIARARDITPGDPYVHFVSALISVRDGDMTTVYEELRAAVEMGYPMELLAAEPHLKALRNDPGFVALTEMRIAGHEPEK